MSNSWSIEKLAQFTNKEGNVETCMGEILKSPNCATVKSGILKRITIVRGKLVAEAHGRRARLRV